MFEANNHNVSINVDINTSKIPQEDPKRDYNFQHQTSHREGCP